MMGWAYELTVLILMLPFGLPRLIMTGGLHQPDQRISAKRSLHNPALSFSCLSFTLGIARSRLPLWSLREGAGRKGKEGVQYLKVLPD